MTETIFTDNIEIQGSQDTTQLKVVGAANQSEPLQTWENSANDTLIQVTEDGRLEIGDLGVDVQNAAIGVEANLDATSSSQPKRGWHTLGHITGALTDAVIWSVNELELLGSGGVSGLQTALRAKLTHDNSGSATSAELRAGDFEVVNQSGTDLNPVGKATGIHGGVSNSPSGVNAVVEKVIGVESTIQNASGGTITEASAFEVTAPLNEGTIDTLYGIRIPNLDQGETNYALYTGTGKVHIGDEVEIDGTLTVGTTSPNASAVVQLDSTTKGFAVPRMTTTQRNAISAPMEGLMVYNTTLHQFEVYNGTAWVTATVPDASAASVVTYTPTTPGDWTSVPSYVDEALDNTASRIKVLEDGGIVVGSGASAVTFEARLGTSVSDDVTGDVSAVTSIALNRFRGKLAGLYSSGAWKLFTLPTGGSTPTLSLSGDVVHTCYDVFLYDNSGTPTLEKLAWTPPSTGNITGATNANPPVITSNGHGRSVNDILLISGVVGATGINGLFRVSAVTTNTFTLQTLAAVNPGAPGAYVSGGTWTLAFANSSRATALAYQDGILVKNGDPTRRYVGSYRVGSTVSQIDNSVGYRGLWNYYNQIIRRLYGAGTGGTSVIAASVGIYQEHINNYAFRAYGMCGLAESRIVNASATVRKSTGTGSLVIQARINGTSGGTDAVHSTNGIDMNITDNSKIPIATGLNSLAVWYYSLSNTSTVYGQNAYAVCDWVC